MDDEEVLSLLVFVLVTGWAVVGRLGAVASKLVCIVVLSQQTALNRCAASVAERAAYVIANGSISLDAKLGIFTSVRPILRIGEYSLVALQHHRIRYICLHVSADADAPAAITINSNRTRQLKHMVRVSASTECDYQ